MAPEEERAAQRLTLTVAGVWSVVPADETPVWSGAVSNRRWRWVCHPRRAARGAWRWSAKISSLFAGRGYTVGARASYQARSSSSMYASERF